VTSSPPGGASRDVPGVARDASSITAILETFRHDGYASELQAAGGGTVLCHSCGAVSDASLFTVEGFRRIEGASDPDEMLLVAALRCPVCEIGGSIVLTYGPQVTDDDAQILERLPREM
jgi:hypothetical protein